MDKRLTGSFYTPKIISDFLVDYLSVKLNDKPTITVLEPSAGDGIFIKSIFDHKVLSQKIKKVVAVEKNKKELGKIKFPKKSFEGIHSDFLMYQKNKLRKFSLVIGNPPYIKKNLLQESQIKLCKEIHKKALLSDNIPKNIWTAFLIRCIEFTDENGILALVLPSELLQVKFASELRALVLKKFERVEIFTFNELLFKDCKGQDTLLLIGEKKSIAKGVYYSNVEKLADLESRNFTLAQNVNIRESKWTHNHLSTDEYELLDKLKSQLSVVNKYCSSKAGIVTAANDFFIVDSDTVRRYSLHRFVKPIIQKGIFVNGSVVLTKKEFQIIIDKSKPAYLIALGKDSKIKRNKRLNDYLELGIEQKLDERYKMTIRENWYEVPNVGVEPEGFFFKRCDEYPKLIKNNANVLATDSAYIISMNDKYKIENLIFSFYNSLTLSFAELHGRYYGGGVLELTPNEFKNLPIPFVNINKNNFGDFVKDFKGKASIKEICKANDEVILKSIDKNLSSDNLEKLYNIREKLYLRRIKTN